MDHDFEKQKRSTFQIWSDISERNNLDIEKIDLDLHFLPNINNEKSQELAQSLNALGYIVSFYEDDNTLEAKMESIVNSAEEIWYH